MSVLVAITPPRIGGLDWVEVRFVSDGGIAARQWAKALMDSAWWEGWSLETECRFADATTWTYRRAVNPNDREEADHCYLFLRSGVPTVLDWSTHTLGSITYGMNVAGLIATGPLGGHHGGVRA
jgi:hypothetical protein